LWLSVAANDTDRAALDSQERKDAKSQNTNGNPIRLQSKILAVRADPVNQGSIYVAQSNGIVSRVILAVSIEVYSYESVIFLTSSDGRDICPLQRPRGASDECLS